MSQGFSLVKPLFAVSGEACRGSPRRVLQKVLCLGLNEHLLRASKRVLEENALTVMAVFFFFKWTKSLLE